MHYLSHTVMLASVATNTSTLSPMSDMVSILTEYGVQVIIVAMMLLFMWKYMNNVIKRDNKLFENVSPQLEAISKAIADMDVNVSSLVSSHNAHANQSIKALEKDQEDMRSLLLNEQDQLRTIAGQLTVLNSNVEVLFHHVISLNGGYMMNRPQLSQQMMYGNPPKNGDQDNDHYDIHPDIQSQDKK